MNTCKLDVENQFITYLQVFIAETTIDIITGLHFCFLPQPLSFCLDADVGRSKIDDLVESLLRESLLQLFQPKAPSYFMEN